MANPSHQILRAAETLLQTVVLYENMHIVEETLVEDCSSQLTFLQIQAEEIDETSQGTLKKTLGQITQKLNSLKERVSIGNPEKEIEDLNKRIEILSDKMFNMTPGDAKDSFSQLEKQFQKLNVQVKGSGREINFAKNNLIALKEQMALQFPINTPLLSKPTQPEVTIGSKNQYSYKDLARSACGVMALYALEHIYNKGTISSREIDDVLDKGALDYKNAIERIKEQSYIPDNEEHIDFDQLTYAVPGFQLAANPIHFQLGDNEGKIEKPEETYLRVLTTLAATLKHPDEQIGAALSRPPETYALTIKKLSHDQFEILFFDSHGDRERAHTNNAYVLRFNSFEKAVEFLTKRSPYIEEGGLLNWGAVLPLRLKGKINPPQIQLPTVVIQTTSTQHINEEVNIVAKEEVKPILEHHDALEQLTTHADREDLLFSLQTLRALHESNEVEHPIDFQGRVQYHLYFYHLKVKGEYGVKGVFNYGGQALTNEQTDIKDIHECIKRVRVEIILNTLTQAVEHNNIEILKKYFYMLQKEDPQTFEKLKEKLYLFCRDNPSVNKKDPKINLIHWDFGRAGFCNEDGCEAPKQAKMEAIKQVKDFLVKEWSTQEFLK